MQQKKAKAAPLLNIRIPASGFPGWLQPRTQYCHYLFTGTLIETDLAEATLIPNPGSIRYRKDICTDTQSGGCAHMQAKNLAGCNDLLRSEPP